MFQGSDWLKCTLRDFLTMLLKHNCSKGYVTLCGGGGHLFLQVVFVGDDSCPKVRCTCDALRCTCDALAEEDVGYQQAWESWPPGGRSTKRKSGEKVTFCGHCKIFKLFSQVCRKQNVLTWNVSFEIPGRFIFEYGNDFSCLSSFCLILVSMDCGILKEVGPCCTVSQTFLQFEHSLFPTSRFDIVVGQRKSAWWWFSNVHLWYVLSAMPTAFVVLGHVFRPSCLGRFYMYRNRCCITLYVFESLSAS